MWFRHSSPLKDMARDRSYLTSHITFPKGENRQVVTWFGSIHETNFDPEEELSDGAWSVIQRKAKEVVGSKGDDSGEGGPEEDEPDECPVDGCPGEIHPTHKISGYLRAVFR